jgi:hypothetical protein
MRFNISLLFISHCLVGTCYAQFNPVDQIPFSQIVKEQATEMAKAFVKGDYKTFMHYIHPKIVKMAGGQDEMMRRLNKMTREMAIQGMTFNGITFGKVSKIVRNGNQLQGTVPQHTGIKLLDGRVVSTTMLIAVSNDGGRNWTFIDTSNTDVAKLKEILPNLSDSIVIPPRQPPVRYNN